MPVYKLSSLPNVRYQTLVSGGSRQAALLAQAPRQRHQPARRARPPTNTQDATPQSPEPEHRKL
jgi:hypothetical protein